MLTEEQIKAIANQLNEKVEIPKIGEGLELKLINFSLKQADKILEKKLSPEVQEMLNEFTSGIDFSQQNESILTERLIGILVKEIDIPFINEQLEKEILTLFVEEIVEALNKNKKIEA